MRSQFTIFKRTKQTSKGKSRKEYTYYACFRNPQTGEKERTLSIDMLYERLHGIGKPISSRARAYEIATEALSQGKVFSRPEADLPFIDYVIDIWTYETSPYVRKKLREKPNSIHKKHTVGVLQTFRKYVADGEIISRKLKLSDFNPSMAEDVKDRMQELGASSSTINKAMQAMRTAIKFAYEKGYISTDCSDRITNVAVVNEVRGIPSEEEMNRMITFLKENTSIGTYDRARYLIPALAIETGMRQGEIISLHADDISVNDSCGMVFVQYSFNDIDKLKCTKSNRVRHVPITAGLAKELKAYAEDSPNEFVFYSSKDDSRPIGNDTVLGWLKEAFYAIGITEEERVSRKLDFHSLRHYNASVLQGVLSGDEARRLLGHSSMKMTDHYTHEMESQLIDIGKRIEQAMPYVC